ncbi:hypothetical protein Tco_0765877 [Tanacetum coccineum]
METVKLLKSQNDQLLRDLEKSSLMVLGYKTGLESVEEKLEFYKKNESVYVEKINGLKWDIQVGEITIRELRKKLEKIQKEKDSIQFNVDKFENASKSLNKLIECQIVDNCKKGLGYENYNSVPPPYTGNFMPPIPDLSFTGLDKFVNKPVAENSKAMSSAEVPKEVRKYHVKSNLTTVEVDARSIRRIGSHQYAVSTGQTVPDGYNGLQFSESYSYGASHIDKSIPRKEKDPGSFTLPCYINNVCFDNALADLGASVNRTVKYPKGIAKNVLVEIGKFVFPVDVIILDMLENIKVPLILKRPFLSTAMLRLMFQRKLTLEVGGVRLKERLWCYNRSLGPLFGDYIEQNDLNVPVELRRDQVDDLMPTIEECEVVEEFRARNDARMVSKIFGYPSDCDHDKKIRIDCAQNLKFSCMIDFAVLEYMEAYRDEEMGDVIFG